MATDYDHDDEYNIVSGVDDDDYDDNGDDTVGEIESGTMQQGIHALKFFGDCTSTPAGRKRRRMRPEQRRRRRWPFSENR